LLLLMVRFVAPLVMADGAMIGVFGAIIGALVILLWWLFLSRAPWLERLGAIVVMALALLATRRLVHPSISNGMMGMMLPVYAVPILCVALVAAVVIARRSSVPARRGAIVLSLVIACGLFTLIRTGGLNSQAVSDIHWRWTPTPEDRLLAQAASEPVTLKPAPPAAAPAANVAAVTPAPTTAPAAATKAGDPEAAPPAADADARRSVAQWPGFRGANRNGVVEGAQIDTDWSAKPPVEIWRHPIGPGWSSFAVHGSFVYTQEQRGDDELVSSYDLASGKAIWRHRDPARFWESNAGAGPRGTPTVAGGRVYALGGTGILNALDARTGAVIWSRNAASDTGKRIPDWGIASSPLVVGDLVIVATAGMLAAYDITTGQPRWIGPKGGSGYSSPQLTTIDGVPQVVLLSMAGAAGVAPADGTLLWQHDWRGDGIVQPAVLGGGDLLLGSGSGMSEVGVRRIAVTREGAGWNVRERWTSNGLKPYFNDFVVHEGHAYGFDGSILACIDIDSGTRKWKGGRFGHGQLVVLPEQDLLLVLSEEGELALVKAAPDQFIEVARFPALEGKTWNHPVLVGNVVLVRNDHEMAAFRLAGR
jgi:outer membrane protein assembly factor BamB